MTNLYLELDPQPGSDIESCIDDLIRVANQLGVGCEMKFNDVVVSAKPGADFDDMMEKWREIMARPTKYKLVSG